MSSRSPAAVRRRSKKRSANFVGLNNGKMAVKSIQRLDSNQEDLIDLDVNSILMKAIIYWFLLGFFAATITTTVLGGNKYSGFVKDFSVLFIILLVVSMYAYKIWTGIPISEKRVKKKDLWFARWIILLVFFVGGHLMGFFVFGLIKY